MKALIIAGGLGLRLMPLTKTTPKSLIEIGGKPLLGRIVDSLLENNIRDLVIITGHLGGKIEDFMKSNYPEIKSQYVFSPFYENVKIRYIYPMWLAREKLKNSDILYLHGDLVYDSRLANKIIRFPHSGALIKKNFVSKKDFNAKMEQGLITKIGVHITSGNRAFCLPLYKIFKNDFNKWMARIGKFVERNHLDCYAEEALNQVLGKMDFYPVFYEKEFGMEIDDFEDLKKANNFFRK